MCGLRAPVAEWKIFRSVVVLVTIGIGMKLVVVETVSPPWMAVDYGRDGVLVLWRPSPDGWLHRSLKFRRRRTKTEESGSGIPWLRLVQQMWRVESRTSLLSFHVTVDGEREEGKEQNGSRKGGRKTYTKFSFIVPCNVMKRNPGLDIELLQIHFRKSVAS